jgi:hypothetical protein
MQAYHTTHGGDVAERKARYTDMVNKYYDLATSFYEYGALTAVLGCPSESESLWRRADPS